MFINQQSCGRFWAAVSVPRLSAYFIFSGFTTDVLFTFSLPEAAQKHLKIVAAKAILLLNLPISQSMSVKAVVFITEAQFRSFIAA